jgi:predicted component of type VI protein secretion system
MANPKLIVLSEKLRGKSFELTEDLYTAGRSDAQGICIKDSTLSSHHCDFIRMEDGNYLLRDNNSTNGTRINNVPVTEQELKSSDIIQLGGVEVLYDFDDGLSTASLTRTKTGIDLDSTDIAMKTVVTKMDNLSPFAQEERKKGIMSQKIVIAVIGLLALFIVALLVVVLVLIVKASSQ